MRQWFGLEEARGLRVECRCVGRKPSLQRFDSSGDLRHVGLDVHPVVADLLKSEFVDLAVGAAERRSRSS